MDASDVRLVQTCYPTIYLACHTRHTRAATSPTRLSPRDSTLLAHLSEATPTRPRDLARHLGIGAPSMSAAIKRLVRLGYVHEARDAADARARLLTLGPKGAGAMRDSSVLDASRVGAMLRVLAPAQRRRALEGLELLARAAQRIIGDRA